MLWRWTAVTKELVGSTCWSSMFFFLSCAKGQPAASIAGGVIDRWKYTPNFERWMKNKDENRNMRSFLKVTQWPPLSDYLEFFVAMYILYMSHSIWPTMYIFELNWSWYWITVELFSFIYIHCQKHYYCVTAWMCKVEHECFSWHRLELSFEIQFLSCEYMLSIHEQTNTNTLFLDKPGIYYILASHCLCEVFKETIKSTPSIWYRQPPGL